ncbi:MAG: hypothetical protein GF400_06840 [Candidatus Eisenbacteria bacterium]|nr:hypothetical protein [Candidatus Eisenbacteria bacterium]
MSGSRQPASERMYRRVVRAGITSQIAGVVVMSAILFTTTPILLTLSLSLGVFLIALGFLAWLWGVVWGRA